MTNTLRLRSLLIVGASAIAMTTAGAASAAPATATADAEASTAGGGTTIGELVVTAEKREQNLQDVPVAITAFSSQRRELVGINTIQDMTNFTPGLQYNTSTDRISLRGVGRLTNVLSADASVANYNDGVYETFAVAAGRSSLFLDRVEVLRGPQGTLYGRNAIGGAINEISKRPTKEPYAEVRVSYSNYNHSNIEGVISGPLGEKVGIRLSGQWEKQTKGWIKNLVPGKADEGNVIDEWFLEGQIQIQFNERLEMWTKVAGAQWHNGSGGPGAAAGGWTPSPYSTVEFDPSVSSANPVSFNTGYGCDPSGNATNVVNNNPLGCVNPSAKTPWKEARTEPWVVYLPAYIGVASHWTWHADDFDIKYVTGGVYYHYVLTGTTERAPITQYTIPGAFGAPGLVVHPRSDFNYQERNGFWSHEVNIISTKEGPFQWLFGGYFFYQHYKQPVNASNPDEAAFAGPLGGGGIFCALTGGVCASPVGHRWFDNRPDVKAKSAAVFGQIDWKFTDTLKTTLGLRYSWDRKWGTEQVRLTCYGLPACFFYPEYAAAFGGLPAVDLSQPYIGVIANDPNERGIAGPTTVDPATGLASRPYNSTWSAVTGTAGLEWTPDTDTLVYGKYSRGYKSGGYYIGIFTVIAPHPWSDKESVDSFEVGVKKTIGGNITLNAAAFHYGYVNLQIPVTNPATGGGLTQGSVTFYNVPKAVSQGVELEAVWQPIEGLAFLLNYGYLDAHATKGLLSDPADPAALQPGATPVGSIAGCTNTLYGDATSTCPADVYTSPRPVVLNASGSNCPFPNIGAVGTPCLTSLTPDPNGGYQRLQNLKGNSLPNSPKNKIAFNVTYTWKFDAGALSPSLSYIWRGAQFGSLFNRPYYRAPSWAQVDARVTWKAANGKYTIIVYGKNIFNQVGFDAGATAARRYGTIDNPPFGFPFYGGANSVVQGISSTYSVTPPRTYGVELQYRFF